jgi:hypothetical protein
MHIGCALLLLSSASAFAIDWQHEGPRATFQVQSDQLSTSGVGHTPNWVHTVQEFEDFHLTFEYKLAQWAEAAVYLRAPRFGRPGNAGIAIVFAHDFHKQTSKYVTGAIAGVTPPMKKQPENSFEQWHKVSIRIEKDLLHAEIDGDVVQHVNIADQPELSHRLKRGFIGFPDLGYAYSIRNIKIEDLGSPTKFMSLDGWKLRGAGNWSTRDGIITGANGHGVYYAQQRFENFELTALVRSHNHVNGGIFLRGSQEESKPRGFEIQIYSPVEAVYPTGSVYSITRSTTRVEYEERWFLMQIRVDGRSCKVWLDGELVAATDALTVLGEGQIGLQIHSENASVDFRDLRVRSLTPVRR